MQAMAQMPGSTAAAVKQHGLVSVAAVLARFSAASKDAKH
jgi:hypothetical protein